MKSVMTQLMVALDASKTKQKLKVWEPGNGCIEKFIHLSQS
ncbi:hypothetical protein RintRC_1422 [Richelia intracellularis]|nr:hypothetical protein RintRC_1422 [Richelia intracellularis]